MMVSLAFAAKEAKKPMEKKVAEKPAATAPSIALAEPAKDEEKALTEKMEKNPHRVLGRLGTN